MRTIATILVLAGVMTIAKGVDRMSLWSVAMGSLTLALGLNIAISAAIDKVKEERR
jgi:hypothetical protein